MGAHGVGTHAGIVAYSVASVEGDDGPRHHTLFVSGGKDAAMLRTERSDHVEIILHGRGRETIAFAGLDHQLVVLREIGGRLFGLIRALRGALAQRLAYVAAAALFHTADDGVVAAGHVDDYGLIVGNRRQYGERSIRTIQIDAQESHVLIGLAHGRYQRIGELALFALIGFDRPHRSVHGSQIMVSVRLEVDQRDESHGMPVFGSDIGSPRFASVDGGLVRGPHRSLFDGERHIESCGFRFDVFQCCLGKGNHLFSALLYRGCRLD